jgi:hypothetical protein
MTIPRNILVSKVVALVIALAKRHNFCIGESNATKGLPRMYDRDRFHVMNANGGYVCLSNDDPQQTTHVPTELMHADKQFNDIPGNVLRTRHWQSAGSELPRLFCFR